MEFQRLPMHFVYPFRWSLVICCCFIFGLPSFADAQLLASSNQGSARFEFNFSNPGARSLGMGGAFAALADDATAAYANPAGLTNLSRPEVSLEIRNWSYSVPFLQARTDRTSDGTLRVATQTINTDNHVTGPSFISYVYPHKSWTFAFYRHELANFQAKAGTFPPLMIDGGAPPDERTLRSSVELKIAGYGLMSAYDFEKIGLSLGFGLVYYHSTFRSEEVTDLLRGIEEEGPRTFELIQTGNGEDFAVNLGLRWQRSDRWAAGAFYRQGVAFPLAEQRILTTHGLQSIEKTPIGHFRFPNIFGFGLSAQPVEHLLVSAEYDHIAYSKVLEHRDVPGQLEDPNLLGKFKRNDADEIRLGAEYILWNHKPSPAIRIGAWFDPDHSLRFEAAPGREDNATARLTAASFPRGKDYVHFTAGFGLIFNQQFQVDVAADFSGLKNTASLSAVFRL